MTFNVYIRTCHFRSFNDTPNFENHMSDFIAISRCISWYCKSNKQRAYFDVTFYLQRENWWQRAGLCTPRTQLNM